MPHWMPSLRSRCAHEPGGLEQINNNGREICIHTAAMLSPGARAIYYAFGINQCYVQ